METKICCECKIEKNKTEFSRDKTLKDGYTYSCKLCRNKKYKEWVRNNPDKIKIIYEQNRIKSNIHYHTENGQKIYRKNHLKKYNMTIDEYGKKVEEQNNLCAICNEPENQKKNKHLCVDHSHITNENRGLLCSNCNRAIGLLKDDIEILKKAIIYLTKYNNK